MEKITLMGTTSVLLAYILLLAGCGGGGGSGSDDVVQNDCPSGAFCPTLDQDLCGLHNYSDLYVPAGVTLRCAPGCTEPLRIVVAGQIIVAGTIDVSGADGDPGAVASGAPMGAPATPGAVARCGGFDGGDGGASANGAGTAGDDVGTGGGQGGSGNAAGVNWFPGDGGGGGHATIGMDGSASSTAGTGGDVTGVDILMPQPMVSGNGGGGGSGATLAGDGYGGGAGGAGAGALQLSAGGHIEIRPSGEALANGGAGGNCQGTTSSGGGGGSGAGGSIWLTAPSVSIAGQVEANGGTNCTTGVALPGDGAGGDGRIRFDVDDSNWPGNANPTVGWEGTYTRFDSDVNQPNMIVTNNAGNWTVEHRYEMFIRPDLNEVTVNAHFFISAPGGGPPPFGTYGHRIQRFDASNNPTGDAEDRPMITPGSYGSSTTTATLDFAPGRYLITSLTNPSLDLELGVNVDGTVAFYTLIRQDPTPTDFFGDISLSDVQIAP